MNRRPGRLIALLLAVALTVCLLPGPVDAALPNGTASGYNHGLNFTLLERNYVYFGAWDHPTDDVGNTEGEVNPILWRAVGEDNGSGNLTLFSEHILDFQPFHSEGTSNVWFISTLEAWLHGTFHNSAFSGAERDGMAPVVVLTSGDNTSSNHLYLPHTDGSNVYVDAHSTHKNLFAQYANPRLRNGSIADAYWLSDQGTVNTVQIAQYATGNLQYPFSAVDAVHGVRPVFQLDLDDVIYFQQAPDNQYYKASDASYNPQYKLTVVNPAVGDVTGAALTSSYVHLKPDQTLWLHDLQPEYTVDDGDYTVNYKIVDNTTGVLVRYGGAPAASGMSLALDTTGFDVTSAHTVYVWLQKNNERHSHEAGAPQSFTLDFDVTTTDINAFTLDPTSAEIFATADYTTAPSASTNIVSSLGQESFAGALTDSEHFTFSPNGLTYAVTPMDGLPPGEYTTTLNIWNTYSASKPFTVTFTVLPGLAVTGPLPDARVGMPYAVNLNDYVSGGISPYTFVVDPLYPLPYGLTLTSDGMLDGTLDTAGSLSFRILVHDSGTAQKTLLFTLEVLPEGDPLLPSVSPRQLKIDLAEGDTGTLTLDFGQDPVTMLPLATDVTAVSDDDAVADVTDLSGDTATVTAYAQGDAEITFTFNDPAATEITVQIEVSNGGDGNNGGNDRPRSTGRTRSGNGGSNVGSAPVPTLPVTASGSAWAGETDGLTFTVENASPIALLSVSVDGLVLDPVQYSVRTGSVVLTLPPATLATLAPGRHTLTMQFWNSRATVTFTVQADASAQSPAS